MDTDPVLEDLMSQLGDFGKYQLRQHLLHLLSAFLAGIHMLSLSMVAPTPKHRCWIPELDDELNGTIATFNDTWLSEYMPEKAQGGQLDYCKKFKDGNASERTVVDCQDRYTYDTTYYHSSRVMEWNLVCDKRWERAMLQSIYMFGVLMGAIILGSMADKYGRKTIFYLSGILQLLAGLGCAFINNFVVYMITLFFYGMFGSGGAYVTGFVLSMELVGPSKRTLCGTAFSFVFCVGVMVVAGWASIIHDSTMLQCVYALHSLVLVAHWWLIDESIRWLWGQGKFKQAIGIVRKAVKVNGQTFVERYEGKLTESGVSQSNQEPKESLGASDLFKTPNLRARVLNVAFCWFANSLVYYGLSLNSGDLVGNPFLMLFLVGFAEVPAYLTVVLFVDITGRRSLCSGLMLVGGFSCIAAAFVAKGDLIGTILVMVGKFAIAGSFAITYNYTAELFPTVVRNSAVGLGAMAARFSGMLTPMITLLGDVDLRLPTIIFGGVAVASALLALFLPETLNKEMPQTLEDGENFGKGDTGYKAMCRMCRGESMAKDDPVEVTQPLNQP